MKTSLKNLLLVPVLISGLALILTSRVTAQSFKTLYHFDNTNDGRYADHELVLSAYTLYGTAKVGGSSDCGTVFSVKTDGTAFTLLHSFAADFNPASPSPDGAYPQAGLLLSGNTLYGTAYLGGTSVVGMVFKINLDGTGFTNLHSFTPLSAVYPLYTNYDGGYPLGALTLSGQTLYGTTSRGGALGNGCVFAVNTDGTGFTNLHSFADREGRNPQAELVLSGSTLYGTTYEGGSSGSGTVFKLETNGGGFSVVHSFTAIPRYPAAPTNEDGANPAGGLIISGSTLYGTTCSGGKGYGSVFAVNTDGTGFTNLHWFSATCTECQTNSGGAYPQGRLTLVGNTLYGTTPGSENFGPGTIFAVRTDGTGFTTLHKFSNGAPGPLNLVINDDGLYPRGGLLLSDYTLYGTTGQGGSMGYGTVFSLSLLPQLTITTSGAQVVLTWPTNLVGFAAEFTLQSSTNFVFPGAWTPVSPKPVVINGLNTVTELISDGPKFYRLSQ